jgi:hypothetical protein
MQTISWPGKDQWPSWQKILFRFFFIYFILYIAPWSFLDYVPGGSYLTRYYYQFDDWLVNTANNKLFHIYKTLVPLNGSGDTSYAWIQLWLYLLLALLGCMVWTLFDARRRNYNRTAYWFRIMLRYSLIVTCFSYGYDKIFLLQMPFPNVSQLSTPLGDFLPMRLSWMFMGYSGTYQFFAGAIEVIAGLLLLFRRTSTLGAIAATGVFLNVTAMNLGYDIPVKLYSMHLVIMGIVLLCFEYKRILSFFTNQAAVSGNLYNIRFGRSWIRISMWILKIAFIVLIIILPVKDSYEQYVQGNEPQRIAPIQAGVYEVNRFAVNRDTIPFTYADSLRWKDVIFENGYFGSIGTKDTLFKQRYGRGYFNFSFDSATQKIFFSKRSVTFDSIPLFSMKIEMPDTNTILLSGLVRKDTVFAELKKTDRHFQLADKQFHWLSEYNR